MKVSKFGVIFVNGSDDLVIAGFSFETDNKIELQNFNSKEYVIPAVISFLLNKSGMPEISPSLDRESEMIVAGAIEKARGEMSRG
ncbi:hypothetical protein [Citrobacter cronae]|uniref:hypothetical protein n=1 Tax=Citrobacter cronae TaxID=1748967 RepID=UPI00351D1413